MINNLFWFFTGAIILVAVTNVPGFTAEQKDLSHQLLTLDSLAGKNPFSVQPLIALGDTYLKLGIDKEAERFYRKAFAVDPGNALVNLALGEIAISKGEYEQARIMLGKCLSIDPANTDCLNALAEIAFIDKDRRAAKKYYDRVLEIDKKNERALLNSGVLRMEADDTSGAIGLFERYVAAYPDSIKGRMNLGVLYDRTNRFHDALLQFTKVLSLDTTHYEALQSLGVLYFKRKVYMESNTIFERAQKLRSSLPVSIALALGYNYQKETDKALTILEKSILGAREESYMMRLLMADIALVAGKHDAAIEYCKMAHELKGKEHVEQEIVNAIYRENGSNSSLFLHGKSTSPDLPLYKPGSIINLFQKELSD